MVSLKSTFINELKSQLRSINLNARKHLNDVIESRNSETKSTAGDKHETSRAMAQRQIDMLKHQLNNSLSMEKELDQISFELADDKISIGNLVSTNIGLFLISVGFGKIEVSNQTYFAISPASPMAKALMNKTKGDSVQLNGRNIFIEEII